MSGRRVITWRRQEKAEFASPYVLASQVHQDLGHELEVWQTEAMGDLGESIFSGGRGLWSEEGVK